jgi:hypothetical protein
VGCFKKTCLDNAFLKLIFLFLIKFFIFLNCCAILKINLKK